ncbi:MFS transporter [Haematospirillum sp. H1815]|uniref:phosphoglycerate transporter protein PgtP n=1 Tax=Haematospirillum sp. H1815 TaxID=2723108 RepID=UPI001438CA67|nr:phosphoglycerate transporter protein PgtP [Haematospirillum sp. H1815]NKD77705.1 MFS transporter [Haematospirillum sp. H1815]
MSLNALAPAPHAAPLPDRDVASLYTRLRWQIFSGIFIGYAGYYLVRKNFCLAMPYLIEEGYSHGELGIAASGLSVAYGLSKFLMGAVSDHSNPRLFMPLGLFLSATIVFILGYVSWATSSIATMCILLFANGWAQGMGWAPCGRTIVQWWPQSERGLIVSVWNAAHNIGGGLLGLLFLTGMGWFNDWHAGFYVPAGFAFVIAVFTALTLRDTPQSCGLPSVEDYSNGRQTPHRPEQKISFRMVIGQHVIPNTMLWWLAGASVFVHLIRFGVLDWAPTYLKETRDFDVEVSSWVYFLYEWAGIPGTLLCGWISDRLFSARRAPAGILFMVLILCALLVQWLGAAQNPYIEMTAFLAIGFLIYGPVMLIGLHAMELVPKNAVGAAAGFTGLFGYLCGSVAANAMMGYTIDIFGWNGGFALLTGACVMATICLLRTQMPHRSYANTPTEHQDKPTGACVCPLLQPAFALEVQEGHHRRHKHQE